MAGADHHALHAVDLDRALELLEEVVAAVRNRGGERVDLSRMLVLLLGQEPVDLAMLGQDQVRLGVAEVGRVIADHRDVDAVPLLRRQHVLDGHRAFALPVRRRLLLRRIDVGMEVDDHLISLPARPSSPAARPVDRVALDAAAEDARADADVDGEADLAAIEAAVTDLRRVRLHHHRQQPPLDMRRGGKALEGLLDVEDEIAVRALDLPASGDLRRDDPGEQHAVADIVGGVRPRFAHLEGVRYDACARRHLFEDGRRRSRLTSGSR